jgi:hypothetical protein
MLVLSLALAGCGDTKVVLDDTAGGALEADADTDADTDADADADTDVPVDTTALTFLVIGEPTGDAVGLVWLNEDFSATDGTVGTARIAARSATVDAPAPDTLFDVPDYPGLTYRYALPFVFVDADADLAHDAEVVEGVGFVLPLYLAGELPPELSGAGLVAGWNGVAVGGSTEPYPIDSLPLPINLTPDDTVDLGGTLVGGALDVSLDLALVPVGGFEGSGFSSLLYNQSLATPWTMPIATVPLDDQVVPLGDGGAYGSIQAPVAYEDTDGDGIPTIDEARYPACFGPYVTYLYWVAPPTEPLVGFFLLQNAFAPGWFAVYTDAADAGVFLTEAEGLTLEIGGDCTF